MVFIHRANNISWFCRNNNDNNNNSNKNDNDNMNDNCNGNNNKNNKKKKKIDCLSRNDLFLKIGTNCYAWERFASYRNDLLPIGTIYLLLGTTCYLISFTFDACGWNGIR